MKQYTIDYDTYPGNNKVTWYDNGKMQGYDVMSYWETDGYCSRLEEEGYTRAYDVERYEKEANDAKEKYALALEFLKDAKKAPLIKGIKN